MDNCITWVGMDDSANKINVAVFLGQEASAYEEFFVTNDAAGLGRLAKKLKELPGEVRCVYEAGINGYFLQRYLSEKKINCDIAAPSLTPRRSGKRVENDRLDAQNLAKLYRAGELTCITIPQNEQEHLRDLLRVRETAMGNLQRVRHQIARLLMRNGLRYIGGKNWSAGHLKWVKNIHFEDSCAQMVLEEYRMAFDENTERLKRFDEKVEQLAAQDKYKKAVSCLMALKGIGTLTAMTIIAEALDLRRFPDAPAFMAAIGVVPSESSSGSVEFRGSITKTGNRHLRRVLIESAWHYRHSAAVGKTLKKRREGLPLAILEIVRKCDQRLNKKFRRLINRGKDSRKAAVAVSRELAGFIWAIGQVA